MSEGQRPGTKATTLDQVKEVVDNYVVLWRNEEREAARVVRIDVEAKRAIFELISGPEKGKRINSRFDPAQTVYVYSQEMELMAVLDAGVDR